MLDTDSLVLTVRLIGASHLLQPPLTALLARDLKLVDDFRSLRPLGAAVAHNMGVAGVALPTSLGVLMAAAAPAAVVFGPMLALAVILGAFWTWRLYRQIWVLGPIWPDRSAEGARGMRAWHRGLIGIFLTQGPLLLLVVTVASCRSC